LDETLRIEHVREFSVPEFTRVDKTIDSFVKEKWYSKIFGVFWKIVIAFQ
jgi:hypothetical protein